ncbi:GNAT family N-acetyltransferase [Galbitalea sp. SE-J8]|uniref:GNAT family N-acetyltransferase n=1 Tax=Galbitalea sp. SE-J8 TaxID=3054952 RepID=UPI00259C9971|nr:GNAT family N-acetyltransferase [Galbitalea sp. SE-J8]MDM4764202.1 GNAT family N-acetyltransferase [Galbitalea sp. SE-J8]
MTASSLVIRAIGAEDWAAYRDARLRMLAEVPIAFTDTLERARQRGQRAWRERVPLAGGVRFAAIDDGAWVGTMGVLRAVSGRERVATLVGVWVAPERRGSAHGVTDALFAAVEDWAVRLSPVLTLFVHEDNARARAAYARRGFVETGATTPYPLDPSALELEMAKRLDRHAVVAR